MAWGAIKFVGQNPENFSVERPEFTPILYKCLICFGYNSNTQKINSLSSERDVQCCKNILRELLHAFSCNPPVVVENLNALQVQPLFCLAFCIFWLLAKQGDIYRRKRVFPT